MENVFIAVLGHVSWRSFSVSMGLAVSGLVGLVALTIWAPEGASGWAVSACMVLFLSSFLVAFLSHTSPLNVHAPRMNPVLSVFAFLLPVGLVVLGFGFSMSYSKARFASENLDGSAPAVMLEAREVLKANPLQVHRASRIISPLFKRDNSFAPEDVALFQKAHDMGLRSEEIDRVLANGFVRGQDREALIKTLIAAQETAQPGAMGLLAQLAK